MTAVTVITASDLVVVASEIQSEHDAARRCASEAVAHAIKAGEMLLQVKAALPHGAFGPWLAANVEFSDRTARGYMQLAGLDEAKRQRVADLSLREAMVAIADQREPIEGNVYDDPGNRMPKRRVGATNIRRIARHLGRWRMARPRRSQRGRRLSRAFRHHRHGRQQRGDDRQRSGLAAGRYEEILSALPSPTWACQRP
ncbi:MAG: DUF3102 domain-containing protein [Betaproteobacteria bacterium]|nr:DUF3102 domain-containing protein [Betaproteobacteria bacterium]